MAYQFPPSFTTQFYPYHPNITTVTPSFPSYSTNISLVTPSQNLSYNHGYTPHLQPAYDYYTPFYQQNNFTPFIPPYQPTREPSDSTSHHSNVFPIDHYHHQQASTSISPHLHSSYTISQQTHLSTDSVQELFQECCKKLAQAEEKYQNQKRAIEEKYQASLLSIKKRSQELKEKYVFKRYSENLKEKEAMEKLSDSLKSTPTSFPAIFPTPTTFLTPAVFPASTPAESLVSLPTSAPAPTPKFMVSLKSSPAPTPAIIPALSLVISPTKVSDLQRTPPDLPFSWSLGNLPEQQRPPAEPPPFSNCFHHFNCYLVLFEENKAQCCYWVENQLLKKWQTWWYSS